jgi:hypothetical protein
MTEIAVLGVEQSRFPACLNEIFSDLLCLPSIILA